MNNTNKTVRAGALAMAVVLAACAVGPSLGMSIEAQPSDIVGFRGLRVTKTERGLLVTGTVRRASITMTPMWGHLHISAILANGPPVTVDTRWSGNLTGRNYRSATFSALLPGVAADQVRTITVAYRPGADKAR